MLATTSNYSHIFFFVQSLFSECATGSFGLCGSVWNEGGRKACSNQGSCSRHAGSPIWRGWCPGKPGSSDFVSRYLIWSSSSLGLRNHEMARGICKPVFNVYQAKRLWPSKYTCIIRTNKTFIEPATIDTWAIAIFERQQAFPPTAHEALVKDFLKACEGVGESICFVYLGFENNLTSHS